MKTVKRILYISAFAALGIMPFTSCEDFLTAENKSAGTSADDYFRSEAGLNAFRITAYSYLKNVASPNENGSMNLYNIYEDGTDLYTGCRGRIPSDWHLYTAGANDGDVTDFYAYCKGLINNANAVLYYGGEDSPYAPEMHFLRAYGYYLLTQQFGSVPYLTDYVQDAETNYPRTDLKTIYDGEIAALMAVKDDSRLPATNHEGYVSQRAVKALLAKLNLAAGWDLETTLTNEENGTYTVDATNYFQQAAALADEAIAGERLTMSFEDKWSPFNEGNANTEEIFSVQYERNGNPGDVNNEGHGLQNDFSSYDGTIVDTGGKYCGSKRVPSLKSLELWEPGDTRYAGTFMQTRYNYSVGSEWGQEGYYAWYNVGTLDETTLPIAFQYFPSYMTQAEVNAFISQYASRLAKGSYVNSPFVRIMSDPIQVYDVTTGQWSEQSYVTYIDQNAACPTPCVKKWDDPATDSANDDNGGYRDVVVLHLSEIYLVAAEAYYMAGDEATSLARLNEVRDRAGATHLNSYSDYTYSYSVTPAFQASWSALDVILDERARELYAEGYRWMDLRRTKQLVRYNVAFNSYVSSVAAMQNNIGETKWYKPIPTDEINSNTALSDNPDAQNPGY